MLVGRFYGFVLFNGIFPGEYSINAFLLKEGLYLFPVLLFGVVLLQPLLKLLHFSKLHSALLLVGVETHVGGLMLVNFMGVFAGFFHVFEAEVNIDVGLILSESVVFEVNEVWGLEGRGNHSGSVGGLVVRLLLEGMLIKIGFVKLLEKALGSQVFLVEVAVALVGLSVQLAFFCYIQVVKEVVSLLQHTKNLIITTILL